MKELFGVLLVTGILGCSNLGPPKPTSSEYYRTKRGGVVYLSEIDKFSFSLHLSANKEILDTLFYSAEFQNPENIEQPLVQTKSILPGTNNLMITSPPFGKYERFTHYLVSIKIFSNEKMTEVRCIHSQHIQPRIKADAYKEIFKRKEQEKSKLNGHSQEHLL